MRLTRKFILALVLGTIAVLGASAAVSYEREVALFDSDMRNDAVVLGRALAGGMKRVWAREGQQGAFDFLGQAFDPRNHIRVRWVWLDDLRAAGLPPAALEPLARGALVVGRVSAKPDGALYTYVPVDVPGPRPGALELREPLERQRLYVRTTLRNTVIVTLVLALVSALLATVLGILFVGRPVGRLAAKARRVGAGDLSEPLHLRQRDELGELAVEMNRMCDRLAAETAARQAATEQLRHADRLTTVGKLASGVAHELGTPLNVVAGRAQMIADGEIEAAEARDSARIIGEQAQRMTRIIRQLLDFARPRPPQKTRSDVAAVAERSVALLRHMAERAGVTLEVARGLPDGTPPLAEVDDGQLQQVFTNLVVNAIHATPRDGRVRIDFGRGRFRPPAGQGSGEGDYLCVGVEDSGRGMDPETAARIFEPFFTTKGVGEGTGLGLSVTYGIVREHGGWIAVKSAPEAGTRFSIYLPMAALPSGSR